MIGKRSECEPLAYVYGGITIGPKPPPPFKVGVKVTVSGIEAALSGPTDCPSHILWYYFAVIRPGQVKVVCSAGNILVTKEIDAKPNQLTIANFCFGTVEAASKEVQTSEIGCEGNAAQYPIDTQNSHSNVA